MHFFADTAQARPVVNKEGLEELDAHFRWRRTAEAESPAGGTSASGMPDK
jgi:hypothetical protein